MPSCNRNDLKPVDVAQNSYVDAADGWLLGSIPAEKNRQPVDLSDMSKWVPRATVAIEDRRFSTPGWPGRPAAASAPFSNGSARAPPPAASPTPPETARGLRLHTPRPTAARE